MQVLGPNTTNSPESRPLRVVFSNYDDLGNPFYGGGGALAIHKVASRLPRPFKPVVLTGRFPGSRDQVIDGIEYRRVGGAPSSPRLGQLWFHFALPFLARRIEHDLWVESLTPPFSTACLQLFTRKPVTLLTQNLPGRAMARKYHLPFHWFESAGLKTYRYGIALSDVIRQDLKRSNAQMQIEVIPNGVDQEAIDRKVDNAGEHILFLGRLDMQQKGLDLLLNSIAAAGPKSLPPVIVAGSGVQRDEELLRGLIAKNDLSTKIQLAGKVQGAVKEDLFRRALFLVMPSRFEGLPITLLEAFCWKLPVVLFDIPELAFAPDSCVRKVSPFDVTAFGREMLLLSADAELRARMGSAAKLYVRQFSWDNLASRYAAFFAKMTQRPQ